MTPAVVLVVDDVGDHRETLCELLRGEGYDAFAARDGAAALALLPRIPRPGVIVLDLLMPRVSGWELLDALAAAPAWSAIPVLVYSAMWEPRVQLPAWVRFLQKGAVSPDALLAAVARECRRAIPAETLEPGAVYGK